MVRILADNFVACVTSRTINKEKKNQILLPMTSVLLTEASYPLPLLVHGTTLLCVTFSCRMPTLHVAVDVNSDIIMVIINALVWGCCCIPNTTFCI